MDDDPVRALVIEDDPAVRAVLSRTLNDAGSGVLAAVSEYRAHKLSLGHKSAAVIVDVDLAGQDGISAMAGIRHLQPEISLIVVAGGDRDGVLYRMRRSACGAGVW